jgi:hypothetical protein
LISGCAYHARSGCVVARKRRAKLFALPIKKRPCADARQPWPLFHYFVSH